MCATVNIFVNSVGFTEMLTVRNVGELESFSSVLVCGQRSGKFNLKINRAVKTPWHEYRAFERS